MQMKDMKNRLFVYFMLLFTYPWLLHIVCFTAKINVFGLLIDTHRNTSEE